MRTPIMPTRWRLAAATFFVFGCSPAGFCENHDLTDPTKLASVPNQTPTTGRTFMQNVWVADIVAVNGKPARGTYVNRTQSFGGFRPTPAAGQNVADVNRNGGPTAEAYETLQTDGTPIGTIMVMGLVARTPPPDHQ